MNIDCRFQQKKPKTKVKLVKKASETNQDDLVQILRHDFEKQKIDFLQFCRNFF